MSNPKGECTQCGDCCSQFLPISRTEQLRIEEYIKEHDIKDTKCIVIGSCPFLDLSKPKEKCTIYPVRPLICKAFSCNKTNREELDSRMLKAFPVDMRKLFYGD